MMVQMIPRSYNCVVSNCGLVFVLLLQLKMWTDINIKRHLHFYQLEGIFFFYIVKQKLNILYIQLFFLFLFFKT